MSGAVRLLPLYVFVARKGTASFYSRNRVVCLDTSECGSKIPGKLWNAVLEKVKFRWTDRVRNDINNMLIYCNWVVTRWQWLFYV